MASNKNPFKMTEDQIKKDILTSHTNTDQKFDAASLFAIVKNILNSANDAADRVFGDSKQPHTVIKDESVITTGFIPPLCTLKELSYEMACKDPSEEMAYITTKSILEKLKDYSWYAKAVLTLAAFALDYGDFCKHLDESSSQKQLTGSLGILKGIPIQPNTDQKYKVAIPELNKLIKETFNFIDFIVMLEDRSVKYDRKDVPSLSTAMDSISIYVFWAIITVVACSTRMSCLIKDESQTQELSHYAKKIDDTLDKLKLRIEIVEKEVYWKLKRFLQEPHDIVDVLKELFFASDNRQPVKIFDKETILSIEVVKEKKVLLFFSGLEFSCISEYVEILKTISTCMEDKYKIMWIPIVEPWTSVTEQEFDMQRQNMPWYVVQQFSSISGINYVKEQWQFKNKPIIVVLNAKGKVKNHNALHMIMAWRERAIPFSRSKEDELRNSDDWFRSVLMTEICKEGSPTGFHQGYIFFYGGGQDEKWVARFPEETRHVKNDSVIKSAGISIEWLHVVKEPDIFWKNIANYWFFTKSHNDPEIRPETKKILNLLSYKEKGWVVLCKGARLVFSGYGTTVLTVLKKFDEWKQQVKTNSEFLEVFEKHYDEELAKEQVIENKKNCLDFDMSKIDGLIADGMKCPDCPKTMEMYLRFKCCH